MKEVDYMKYVADMHTHTIASGHAYNTITEMAKAAADIGLKLLGITEHAVSMPGTCHNFYFQNLKMVKRELFGVELALGVELNIIDYNGNIDMGQELLKQMDVAIASIHSGIKYEAGSITQNTNAVLQAMKNPYINIIGHPDDSRVPMDYKELVLASKEYNTLLEINNNSLTPGGWRVNPYENDKRILELCAENNIPVIIGSDAHTADKVGCHDYAIKLINEIHFPEELIANYDIELLKTYLNKYRKEL